MVGHVLDIGGGANASGPKVKLSPTLHYEIRALDIDARHTPMIRDPLVLHHQGINKPLPIAIHILSFEFGLLGLGNTNTSLIEAALILKVNSPKINDRVQGAEVGIEFPHLLLIHRAWLCDQWPHLSLGAEHRTPIPSPPCLSL
ncbi:hypothetical protein HAX54_001250 [Datura stramonium]|uniref:Uncharacterized protein n=1 Tax=Datura stramonium TaxID=4076 RepID=A0ABS8T2S0_DATST|nr:hypothetical protein [Datura stramonium]